MEKWAGTIIYFALIFGLFYLVLIRPQQKQQKKRQQMLSELKVNDEVITAGGIYGTIMRIKDDTVKLKIADKVEIDLLKSAIASKKDEENQ